MRLFVRCLLARCGFGDLGGKFARWPKHQRDFRLQACTALQLLTLVVSLLHEAEFVAVPTDVLVPLWCVLAAMQQEPLE